MSSLDRWGSVTDVVASKRNAHAVAAGVEVSVTSGPDRGARASLDEDRLTIGTAESNHLVLHDRAVSRFHCELVRGPAGILLRDLGSTNGTHLSGFAIREVFLKPDAGIRIGRTDLVCEDRGTVRLPLSVREGFGELVGKSVAMRRLFEVLERLAKSDASVLLQGETGTGKELVARALHEGSRRRDGPFVVVDAGALPQSLVESELFGHEKGAFTGAVGTRVGAFEAADGGTLLIDELGELPVEMQPKLLRALENREIRRLGSNQPRQVDVRFIAATHRDLRSEVNQKAFRSDLYYRIAQVTVHLPPLRERAEDIPLLVEHFLDGLDSPGGRPEVPAGRIAEMQRHSWPGNVRELRNYIERAVILGSDAVGPGSIRVAEGTGEAVDASIPFGVAKEVVVSRFERAYLEALMTRTAGNVSRASREAHVDRSQLLGMLRKHGLR